MEEEILKEGRSTGQCPRPIVEEVEWVGREGVGGWWLGVGDRERVVPINCFVYRCNQFTEFLVNNLKVVNNPN